MLHGREGSGGELSAVLLSSFRLREDATYGKLVYSSGMSGNPAILSGELAAQPATNPQRFRSRCFQTRRSEANTFGFLTQRRSRRFWSRFFTPIRIPAQGLAPAALGALLDLGIGTSNLQIIFEI